MAAPRLGEHTRRKLLEVLSEDRPDPGRLLARLRDLRRLEEIPACAELMRLLANLTLAEPQAERILGEILEHRVRLGEALGRDPGMRVAAVDYLSNVEKLLANPKIVEMAVFEQTQLSAVTDPLTGLYNRRYFRAAMRREVRRSKRYKLTFSLLMLDLDRFKRVNDEHGHIEGDRVLRIVADLIRRSVREADVACRFGGEEFTVILPETDRLGTHALADRIRQRVELRFAERRAQERSVPITVSGGIASFPEDGFDSAVLIGRADETLYHAKRAGRNRIMMYPAERRRSVRYPARPATRLGIKRVEETFVGEGLAINVSLDGALLEAEARFRATDEVRLFFADERDGPGAESRIVEGQVVRVEREPEAGKRVRIGVAFTKRIPERLLHSQIRRVAASRAALRGVR